MTKYVSTSLLLGQIECTCTYKGIFVSQDSIKKIKIYISSNLKIYKSSIRQIDDSLTNPITESYKT